MRLERHQVIMLHLDLLFVRLHDNLQVAIVVDLSDVLVLASLQDALSSFQRLAAGLGILV